MTEKPTGQHIEASLGVMLKPLMKLFNWWLSFDFPGGATYFVMPDGFAILGLFFLPAFFAPTVYIDYFLPIVATFVLSPVVLLSGLRIKNGRVIHIKFFLLLPYWFRRVPKGSRFEIYEAWEDAAPSGVAFTLPHKSGAYLHLGMSATATELEHAIGSTLQSQGWVPDPSWRFALTRLEHGAV